MLDFVTRRPVAISMLTLAVLLFGWVSSTRLNVTLLPDLSYPTATVRTDYAGAAPAEIESLISKPIEEALGLVRQVRRIESVSRAGQSDVTLEFDWGTQMDFAVLDIREKLDALQLPREADRPIVLRVDPSSEPIMRYGLSSKADGGAVGNALKRLRRVAEDSLQKPLEALPGVAAVKVSGGLEEEIQVELDLRRLAQLDLSSDFVIQRLAQENVNLSGGRVDEGSLRYLVRTRNQFASLDDIRELILLSEAGRVLRLKDLARVLHGHHERDAIIRIDGREAVEIAIYREGDGNTVAVANAVAQRIERLAENLPEGMTLTPLYDQSAFIQQAIGGVMSAAALGGLLAVLVLYLFLGEAWSTLVIAVAIPVSVIASFILMYAAGLSLNIMSLGGLALAVGLLIDSAIVVLESIARRRESGADRIQAAQDGTRQVLTAIAASTFTTVAVFFPMVFVEGVAGQLFADQALVVSGTLLIALVVAVTLIPMLAARDRSPAPVRPARPPRQDGHRAVRWLSQARHSLLEILPGALLSLPVRLCQLLAGLLGRVLKPTALRFRDAFGRLEQAYRPALNRALDHPARILAPAVLLFGTSLALLSLLGAELLPPLSQGEFQADLRLPPGVPLERTDALVVDLQRQLTEQPQLRTSYAVSGTGNRLDTDPESAGENTARLSLVLESADRATETQLIRALRDVLADIPGLDYAISRPTLFSFQTPLKVEFAGHDLQTMGLAASALLNRMQTDPRFTDIETSVSSGQPEIQIRFDQQRVSAMGLQVPDLAERVVQAVQGRVATRYRLADREIDVLVRAEPSQRHDIAQLRDLIMNPGAAAPVPLAAVAQIELASGPSEIRRVDHQRVVTVSADLREGDLASGVAALQKYLDGLPPLQGVSASVTGQSEEMAVSFASLQFALGLAVFLVYLVMASQFESLLHPFIILMSLPLAGTGAIVALLLTGTVINVVVLIGLIVLAGIVVNNGIVLIDRINQLRSTLPGREAILSAAAERLRPILMTSLTTILGLLPLALAGGEGSELRAPLAITVIGGLSLATALTLFLVPVLYSLIDREPETVHAPD